MKKLLKWADNWADEIDIEGFVIVDVEEADEWYENMIKYNKDFSVCIGTNEEIDYSNGAELLKRVSIKDISEEEELIVVKILELSNGRLYEHKNVTFYGETSFFQKYYNNKYR